MRTNKGIVVPPVASQVQVWSLMPGATVDDMGVGMDGIGSGGYRSKGLPATRPGVRISPPDPRKPGRWSIFSRRTSDNYTSIADLTLSRIQPSANPPVQRGEHVR
jgi:hypothetical protein